MRLRKLGTTQSLVFFLPPEVHQSIMDICKKGVGDHFDSKDVLYWLLEQTCLGIEQLQPLYYSQGVDFCRRMHGAIENANFLANDGHREQYVKIIKQPEKQTLEQLYKPVGKPKTRSSAIVISPQVAIFMKELQARRKAFQDSGSAVQASALQEVEQEREVAYEVQAVRESQKPVHYSPLSFHGLHQDILKFLETGRLTAASEACDHFLVYLERTTLGIKYGVHGNGTSSKLYLSREFSRTVLLPNSCPNSDFMVIRSQCLIYDHDSNVNDTAPSHLGPLEYNHRDRFDHQPRGSRDHLAPPLQREGLARPSDPLYRARHA